MASFLHRLLDAAQIDLPTPIDYGFRDVGADETHRDSINQMAVTGVLDGYRDGSFKPDASITRAQMATMIVGAFEYATQVELEVGDVPFNDVHGVHAENIARAFNAGLLNGTTGSTFDPASSTTRAQMATALTHMLDELVERHLAELPR
ncbi:MAG: S-layer homology domain-containing protein [Candidatus Saccharimonadales bacterium]